MPVLPLIHDIVILIVILVEVLAGFISPASIGEPALKGSAA